MSDRPGQQNRALTRRRRWAGLAALIASISLGPEARAQDYAVIDLGGSSSAVAINQHGWVTGARGESAYLWRNGVFEMRPRQGGGCCSFGYDINDLGDIAGRQGPLFNENAAMWLADGTLIDIGKLAPPKAEAHGINSSRTVIGWTYVPGPDISGFVWKSGEFVVVQSLTTENPGSSAAAINDIGQVTGAAAYNQEGDAQAYLWENGQIRGLGVLEEDRSSLGKDINNNTQVVGFANFRVSYHAFLWEDGKMTDINQDPPAKSTFALAINDSADIVGQMEKRGSLEFLACIWRSGVLSDLNESLPSLTQWKLIEARDINNHGQIVGNGEYRQQNNHAFMLSPVTPTLALSPPVPGRAGAVNTLTITGCDPGARIHFLYARHGGGTIIPGCDLQQNALQLDQPILIGSAIADEDGEATLTRFVPNSARNLGDLLIQAVQQNGCRISRLVIHEFE